MGMLGSYSREMWIFAVVAGSFDLKKGGQYIVFGICNWNFMCLNISCSHDIRSYCAVKYDLMEKGKDASTWLVQAIVRNYYIFTGFLLVWEENW